MCVDTNLSYESFVEVKNDAFDLYTIYRFNMIYNKCNFTLEIKLFLFKCYDVFK